MMRLHNKSAARAITLLALLACTPAALALEAPVIQSATTDNVDAGQPYNYTIAATNNPTSFNATGLPSGLTVNTNNGKITGTTTEVAGSPFKIALSATNAAGTGTATLTLTVKPTQPVITNSPLSANGSFGLPFSYRITASGIPAPTFTASPLPPGLTFGADTISGQPLQSGNTFVTVTATNTKATVSALLTINITSPPVITSPLVIPGAVGQAMSYTIAASNNPTGFAVEPPGFPVGLPLGVNANTGQVTGTPTTAGTFTVVLSATNAVNSSSSPYVFQNSVGKATATVLFAISNPAGAPAITSVLAATGMETVPFVYGITASNAPTQFSVNSGTPLPAGLSLDATTGIISGVPALLVPAIPVTTPVTIIASNNQGSGQATLNITINLAVPQITSDVTTNQVTLSTKPFGYQTTATTFTDPAITANTFSALFNPPIPSGNISMAPVTGLLSGTPTAGDVGSYTVTLTVSNNRGASSAALQLLIVNEVIPGSPPIVITSPLKAAAVAGAPFTYQIIASGAGVYDAEPSPFTFLSGHTLPGHLVIDSTTGLISGTPQLADVGVYTVILFAGVLVNGFPVLATQANLELTILPAPVTPPPPSITSAQAVGVFVGNNLNYTITTAPDPQDPTQNQLPLLFSATGVPLGLGLNPDSMLVLGTPQAQIAGTATQVGISNASVSVLNATGSDTHNVAFTVAPVTITSALTATGQVGVNFTPYVIRASGNPNVFSATGLPPGLSVDVRTGIITGIPVDTNSTNPVVSNVTISASNGYGSASATLAITINPKPAGAPEINLPLTATGTDSVPFTYQITATNSPISFGASGLPLGLSIDTTNGKISGTTSQVGSYSVIITAGNVAGTDAELLALTINQAPPAITSPLSATATLGQPFRYAIQTTGSQPQTYQAAPLPAGLALDANIISGTPTVPGVSAPVTLTVSNLAATVSASLTITVLEAPIFGAVNPATTTLGDSTFSFTVSASGFPAPTLSLDPATLTGTGLTFQAQPPSGMNVQGILRGTPQQAGTLTLHVTATNTAGVATETITVTVNPVAITSPLTLAGVANTPIAPYTITATGNTSTYSATGLPPGLVLNGAVISGTPTAAGTTEVTITAGNGIGQGSATLIVGISTVPGAPAILSGLLLAGTKNLPLSYAILANNSPTSYSATGLPAGLSIDTAAGLISGTPTVSGSFGVTISASNAVGTGSATLRVAIADVAGGPAIGSPLALTVLADTDFTYQITSINGPILAFGASNLPANLSVDTTTGLISGHISLAANGVFQIALSAQNSVATAQATLVLTVLVPTAPSITSPLAVTGGVGVQFSYQITASGFPAPTFAAAPLPPGLSLLAGVITGIPTTAGSYAVTLTATNSVGSDSKTLVITIAPGPPSPPVISSPLTAAGTAGLPFTYTITASGTAPIAFSATGLPPGLTLSGAVISGTPTTEGTYTVTLTAGNSAATDVESLVIVVAPEPDDLDVDGFPNELETALGTDPLNPASTPFDGRPAGVVQAINILDMTVKLNFVASGKDAISIRGALPLNQALSPAGQQITLVVGGIVQRFTLDTRGSSGRGSSTFSLRVPKTLLQGKFSAKLTGDFKSTLSTIGLTNSKVRFVSRTVRVFIMLDKTALYDSEKLLSYTVTAGRFGTAKTVKTKF